MVNKYKHINSIGSSDLEMGSIGYMYNKDLEKVYFVYDLDLEQWEKLTASSRSR